MPLALQRRGLVEGAIIGGDQFLGIGNAGQNAVQLREKFPLHRFSFLVRTMGQPRHRSHVRHNRRTMRQVARAGRRFQAFSVVLPRCSSRCRRFCGRRCNWRGIHSGALEGLGRQFVVSSGPPRHFGNAQWCQAVVEAAQQAALLAAGIGGIGGEIGGDVGCHRRIEAARFRRNDCRDPSSARPTSAPAAIAADRPCDRPSTPSALPRGSQASPAAPRHWRERPVPQPSRSWW